MKLLWVGDAACDSGFAKCTHNTLEAFEQSDRWEVAVLGINYRGDPNPYQRRYNMYPALVPGGDMFGVRRTCEIITREKADVVVFQNDPWNIPAYIKQVDRLKHRPFLVGAIAVDGKNCRGEDLNGLDLVIFWTKFAQEEAIKGGLVKPSAVVPLGVDIDVYSPGDRHEAREKLGMFGNDMLPTFTDDSIIFLNVNRNQPRKRLDLTLEYFAAYYHTWKHDAYLYLHVCPTGDLGYDIAQLTKYHGLRGRVILAEPGVYHGSSEEEMVATYRAANVGISTTQGEGWGLTTMEGMACGIPQIVPDWSALGEWAADAAYLVPCSASCVTPNKINVIGGVPDKADFVNAMADIARLQSVRDRMTHRGLSLVQRPQYRWENIGKAFLNEVEAATF